MAEPTEVTNMAASSLPNRLDKYRAEVEQIVANGIEHPTYELKRSATISKENLADRLDFIKLIQGLANAHIEEERCLVIGADQKERKFYNVENTSEFDPANLSQVVSKYLDPPPRLEVFNNCRTSGGKSYVLIVVSPHQGRPVVAVCEGTSQERTHFRLGDIWIKKDTSLQLATRADLDAMYERYIDEESENRARRRFQHLREELRSDLVAAPAAVSTPRPQLLVGSREQVRSFAESVISTGDFSRLKMLIEMARDRLVAEWDAHGVNDPIPPEDPDVWNAEIEEFYRDGFIPAFESAVELGLQVIKYDAAIEWLHPVVELLLETFETCQRLDRLRFGYKGSSKQLPFAKPGLQVYIGIRALATYAIHRRRYHFLRELLPQYVRFLTANNDSRSSTPVTFEPFSRSLPGVPDMGQGRNRILWEERVQGAWAHYFGSIENFLGAAARLEFVLEFNSYLFTVRSDQTKDLRPGTVFGYVPDFWTSRLDPTVPIAEAFYDGLSGAGLPADFVIEPEALELVLKGKGPQERLLFLGEFLAHLRSWQEKVMWQNRRFPFMFDWPGRLNDVVDAYLKTKKQE